MWSIHHRYFAKWFDSYWWLLLMKWNLRLCPLSIFLFGFILQGKYKEPLQALKYFWNDAKMISKCFDHPEIIWNNCDQRIDWIIDPISYNSYSQTSIKHFLASHSSKSNLSYRPSFLEEKHIYFTNQYFFLVCFLFQEIIFF